MGVPLFIISLDLSKKVITMIAIGVDIGGTSIKGALVNEKGQIIDRFSMKVSKSNSALEEINKLCDIINDTIKRNKLDEPISGIGIGIPGILDMDQGIVILSPNLPTWSNFNIKEAIEKRTGIEVIINNDANVAALGEAKFGSGSNYSNSLMITLGTGVGGGIIIDGKLYDGNKHQGAELGHSLLVLNGRQCGCGRKGCLEAYASATGLVRSTKEAMEEHKESLLWDVEKEHGGIDAQVAFIAANRGDLVALTVVNQYVMYLSEGLIDYCNIFRPEVIILSGGVANEGENLFSRVRAYLKEHTYGMRGSPKVEVVPASLGYDSGKIGAACLVLFK